MVAPTDDILFTLYVLAVASVVHLALPVSLLWINLEEDRSAMVFIDE